MSVARDERTRSLRDAALATGVGLVARLAVVIWAAQRFPPTDDGAFYQVVATRIARGLGYTWLWPDGAVTYAAHYPVGYPALIGAAYALFGPRPLVAMLINALLGSGGVWAVHRLAARVASRRGAAIAALLAALHPGLVFYTPALMTEGVVAAWTALLTWLAVRVASAERRGRWLVALGFATGILTLMRPELLLFGPCLGLIAAGADAGVRARLASVAIVSGTAILLCLPWTARNCARMDRCVFVSANGGWNLLIGSSPRADGAWLGLDVIGVPPECRTVFGEAEKDVCFGRAGLAQIRARPLRYLGLIPRKLSLTFDFFGAPGHYLHASNPAAFDDRAKLRLDVFETLWERLVLLGAIVQVTRAEQRRSGRVLGVISGGFALLRPAWLAYLGWLVLVALLGREAVRRPALLAAAWLTALTAAVHAVFFGGGRYGLVCAVLLCAATAGGARRGQQVLAHGL